MEVRCWCPRVARQLYRFLTEVLSALNGSVTIQVYATLGTSAKEPMVVPDEQLLKGVAIRSWVVLVLWATRPGVE